MNFPKLILDINTARGCFNPVLLRNLSKKVSSNWLHCCDGRVVLAEVWHHQHLKLQPLPTPRYNSMDTLSNPYFNNYCMQDALYCYIEGWFISWKWKIKSFHNLNQHDNISSYWNNSLNIMDVDRTMNEWRKSVRRTTPSAYRSKRFKGVIYNSESQKNTIFFLYELKIKGAWRSIPFTIPLYDVLFTETGAASPQNHISTLIVGNCITLFWIQGYC